MKLYIHPLSSNARRATIVAHHLGLSIETIFVDLQKGAQRNPDYLALHPGGKVPVLNDNGFILTESWAIMAYLADQKPSELYPSELKARAVVQQWLFWTANHISPHIATLNFENMIKAMLGAGPADTAKVAHAEKELRTYASILDDRLSNHRFITGSAMTIADFAVACSLMSTVPAKLPVTDFVHLQRWYSEIKALPAWQATEPTMG
jgi:glutathione S-transferase